MLEVSNITIWRMKSSEIAIHRGHLTASQFIAGSDKYRGFSR
jgi:hypothetical protein